MGRKTKEKMRRREGITLIALVVTIIVLIVLAGVSITLVLGNNGIVTKAKEGATKYERAQAREKLELVLMEIHTEKVNNATYTDEDLEAKLEENEMQLEGNIVTVDGWQFEIDRDKLEIIDEGNKIEESNKYIKVSAELEKLLKEAKMTIGVKEVLNTPDIINQMSSTPENNITAEELGKLLTEANIEEITLSQMVTNDEFTKDLINKLSITTIANNTILREHVNALIPTITEADVTREIIDGEITYRDKFGGKTRVSSEHEAEEYEFFGWRAFDNTLDDLTFSMAGDAIGYYIEYEFAQPVYAIEIRYIFVHGSSHEGTRTIVIQGYDEENNQWKEVSEELTWTGPNEDIYKEDKVELEYKKSYRRYRLYVKDAGGNEFGSSISGVFTMQLYGKLAE